MVYGCQILISIDIYDFYFFVFSSVFILIEKAYITLKTVFEHLFSWKTLRIFDSLLGVSKVVKHYLLCMIHHTNWGIFEKSKNFLSRAKNRNQKAWKALEDPRWPCWLHEKLFSVSALFVVNWWVFWRSLLVIQIKKTRMIIVSSRFIHTSGKL